MMEYENYCWARDKETGQCFGQTWFKHEPRSGPRIDCPGDCKARRDWEERTNKQASKGEY